MVKEKGDHLWEAERFFSFSNLEGNCIILYNSAIMDISYKRLSYIFKNS